MFSNVRTYLRNVAIIEPALELDVCSSGFTVLRSNGAIEPRFLFRYVLSDEFIERVTPMQRGAHYPATTDRVVRNEKIPLPPLAEQRRIVSRVDSLLGEVQEVQASLVRVGTFLTGFRQAILAAAGSGELTLDWRGRKQQSDTVFEEHEPSDEMPAIPTSWKYEPAGAHGRTRYGYQLRNCASGAASACRSPVH